VALESFFFAALLAVVAALGLLPAARGSVALAIWLVPGWLLLWGATEVIGPVGPIGFN
jgi:hypothetical protein